jgi:hypothetical protein
MAAILAGAICVGPAWAAASGPLQPQEAAPTVSPAKSSAYNVVLTILFTGEAHITDGPCTGGDGLANICPSGDSCFCGTFIGTATGSAGTGAVLLYETEDISSQVTAFRTDCTNAYADIEINGSKDVESIGFIGAECDSEFSGSILNGGCFLANTKIFSTGGAFGPCGGNVSPTAKTKFTIKGKDQK